MKLKLNKEELEKRLNRTATNEEIIHRKMKYNSFREIIEFVSLCIYHYDFITTGQITKRFGVDITWAGRTLRNLVKLGLLEHKPVVGSNMVEYYPTRDRNGEPKIYRFCEEFSDG
jgi:DNA-binding MarR family transcriptional regulator